MEREFIHTDEFLKRWKKRWSKSNLRGFHGSRKALFVDRIYQKRARRAYNGAEEDVACPCKAA